ncbi:MAG TPA: rhomboid family intramembrane serine protease [Chitinophagales bacterium]|nr:rhomboid family intramembrane serine protease [Chitinophagales bacterium]
MDQFRPQGFNILPMVVKNLLIINGMMFLATLIFESRGVDLTDILGLHFFSSEKFRPYQLITHMFMHGSFLHIFSNMFALWMFGSMLESVWGPKRFLYFYFSCGLGGALAHLGVTWWQIHGIQNSISIYQNNPGIPQFATLTEKYDYLLNMDRVQGFIEFWKKNPGDTGIMQQSVQLAGEIPGLLADIPVVGASGAVFGVLVAFGVLFPNTYLYLYFFLPVKAKYFVVFYAGFELYAGIIGSQDGIAHFAHLGGALVGFLMVKYWNRNLRKDFF